MEENLEEKKVALPKPPKALRQNAKSEPVEVEQREETLFGETTPAEEQKVLEPTHEVAEPKQKEVEPKQKEKPKKSKKAFFEPLTNWVGLFVSLAIFGVFIFLLVIN